MLEDVHDGVVHELHADVASADEHVGEFFRRAFADDGRHGVIGDQDFVDREAAAAVATFEQKLGDDAAQGGGEHGAYLRLLAAGEDVDHTVDGLAGIVGVQGAEDKQAGFGGGQGQGDGFQVAHFTDEHDVGIFTQGGAQAPGEAKGVLGNFALGDDAEFVLVDEFDWFLNRHDVFVEAGVDVVDQCGEGGRFAGTGRAGDQDESAGEMAETFDDGRNVEVLNGGNLGRDETEDSAEAVNLFEEVATETGFLAHLVGEVHVAFFQEGFPAVGGADLAQKDSHFLVGEDFFADGLDVAVDADFGRLSFGQVQVGPVVVDEHLKESVDLVSHNSCGREWGVGLLQVRFKQLFLLGAVEGFVGGDDSLAEQFHQGVVHEAHALAFAGLHDAGQHEGLGFADEIGDRRAVDEDFHRQGAALAVGAGNKLLADDAAQRFGHHDADLGLLFDGEGVEHAVEGAGGAAGVEGAEHQVTGFGCGDGQTDGLQIAHFTDHDDVGIFTKGTAQSRAEGFGVGVNLALGDLAALGGEEVFDWIFEGDDMVVTFLVDLVDHGSQRGRFTAADRAGDQNQTVVVADEGLKNIRQAEFVHAAHDAVDDTKDDIIALALLDDAGTEAAQSFGGIGEFDVTLFFEMMPLRRGEESADERLGLFLVKERCAIPKRFQSPVEAHEGGGADTEVDVGRAELLRVTQEIVHVVEPLGNRGDRGGGGSGRPGRGSGGLLLRGRGGGRLLLSRRVLGVLNGFAQSPGLLVGQQLLLVEEIESGNVR